MYKSTWQIYLNNSIAFILFSILKAFFHRNTKKSNKILFINTGQIGDLIVSSVIFTNEKLLTKEHEVYLLIRERYRELYDDYQGGITIIPWNYNKYKYNIFYRIAFLRSLHKQGFDTCVNVTAARGITNDEVALLSGARKVICLNNNWKYLTKLFGKRMDSHYDLILSFGTINEPERNIKLLEYILGEIVSPFTSISLSDSTKENAVRKLSKLITHAIHRPTIIAIAPFSDELIKNWPIDHYKELISRIIKEHEVIIVVLGTKIQREMIQTIVTLNENKIINMAGILSLLESSAIIEYVDLFIGNDSGLTHIAKALQKKTIGIVGGGGFGYFFPYNPSNSEYLFYHQLDCFGCEWRCHLDKSYCLYNVSVCDVYKAVYNILYIKQKNTRETA